MVNWCCPGGRRATRKDGVTMLYPESRSPRLDAGLFRRPAASLRGVPFWSWNCRVTRALIDAQLDAFAAMGFGGVDIHPRIGLDVEYLGDEFMDLIRYAVAGCKARGLYCWLYDDDRFPSGAAGGLVTRDARRCQRFLLLTETPGADCLPDRARFEAALEAGERPAGYLAARYALTLENGGLVCHRRLEEGEAARPGERLRYGCVMLLESEEWFQGQSYVDVMDPGAIRAFIDITHEAYFRNVGADFGGVVPAIFTDEPRMETRTKRPKALADGDSHGDVILPWSEPLRARMIRERGVDPLDIAPELAWEWADGRPSAARAQFRDAACEQFVAAYMDQIAGWCRAHGILMTGHVLSEDTLYAQAASLGEAMRCYRSMDIPGVDVLCDDRAFLAVKQAASVAHQMGREGVASELYGVTLWNADFKTFKLQGDWQAALGVTARVPPPGVDEHGGRGQAGLARLHIHPAALVAGVCRDRGLLRPAERGADPGQADDRRGGDPPGGDDVAAPGHECRHEGDADRGLIAWAPHRLELGRLEPGAHVLEIDAFVGRHNGFGALHNANDAFRWYGPDAWRTEGDEWTDDYRLLPAGLLSGVELWIQE